MRQVFIVNFKNYEEVLGDHAIELAETAESVGRAIGLEIIAAPPIPMLSGVASHVKIPVFSQKVDAAEAGKSTGSVVPEAVKAAGAAGSLINHSEARVKAETIGTLIRRMKQLGLASCVCAGNPSELSSLCRFEPEYLALEPPELIGTGRAVSRAKPGMMEKAVRAARAAGYRGGVLCGAGIVSGEDARAARRLGTDGILVASAIVKAKDWRAKLRELGEALVSTEG